MAALGLALASFLTEALPLVAGLVAAFFEAAVAFVLAAGLPALAAGFFAAAPDFLPFSALAAAASSFFEWGRFLPAS